MGLMEDSERFFVEASQLEYTEENRRDYDFRTRDQWVMRLFDAWGHCYLGASWTRDVGERATWGLGTAWELLHEVCVNLSLNLLPHDSFSQDMFNQAVGRSIGSAHRTGDLYRLTFDAMLAGRLDLTLAGIPRGSTLRRTYGARLGPRPRARRRA